MAPPDASSSLTRRSPRKTTSIQHGPRRQICKKCTGSERHYRVDCLYHSGNAKRAKRMQEARDGRQRDLVQASQHGQAQDFISNDRTSTDLNGRSEVTEIMHEISLETPRPTFPGIFGPLSVTTPPNRSISFDQTPVPSAQPSPVRSSNFSSPNLMNTMSFTPVTPIQPRNMASFPSTANGHLTLSGQSLPSHMPNMGYVTPTNMFVFPGGNVTSTETTSVFQLPTADSTLQTPASTGPDIQQPSPTRTARRRRPPLTLPGEQRVRPSKSNPIYGLVDGVKRGSERWEVPRKVPKFTLLPTWADCNKKFNEKMQSIVRLAEEVADETGCWIYVAGQMPTGRHEYTHFASHRLRKEAPGPVNDMNAIAHKMFHGLVSARRKDVLHVELEVANSRTNIQKLHKENTELSRAKQEVEAVIQGLRARIAASETVTSEELQAILDHSSSTAM